MKIVVISIMKTNVGTAIHFFNKKLPSVQVMDYLRMVFGENIHGVCFGRLEQLKFWKLQKKEFYILVLP